MQAMLRAMELTRRDILAAALLPALGGFAAPELDIPFVPTPHSFGRAACSTSPRSARPTI